MTTDGACFIPEGYITMLRPLSWDDKQQSIFHILRMNNHALSVVIISWDDDDWWSMLHTWGIYNHALTVVMRRCQLSGHVSYPSNTWPCSDRWEDDNWWTMFFYLSNTFRCSDRWHETVATYRAWFILEKYITMLWPLFWDDGNW